MNDLKTLTLLFRASHSLHESIKNDVKNYGINLSEFAVLEALFHLGDLSASQLKEKVLMAPSSMTYVIDQLVLKGLVYRTHPDLDLRKVMVTLSENGHLVISKSYPPTLTKYESTLRCTQS